jgi:transposase InsO family protein
MSFLATTSGVSGEDVRDLMLAAVEHRFGPVNRLPVSIEWLSDNGSCYLAGKTRSFACDIGLEPRTTPIESPQSNGMAEAFVRTIKRDYVHTRSPLSQPISKPSEHQRRLRSSTAMPASQSRTVGYRIGRDQSAVECFCNRSWFCLRSQAAAPLRVRHDERADRAPLIH